MDARAAVVVTLTMCNVFLDVSVFIEQGQHSVIFPLLSLILKQSI